MRMNPRSLAIAVLTIVGVLGLATARSQAQIPAGYPGGYAGYGVPYGGGYPGGGPYYGGGYGAPTQRYYGNGGHDLQPHWHTTQTPYGGFAWYGNGAHDLQPHEHTRSPYGGYRGYSPSPFGGVTTSYYNSTPYTYMPW